MEKLKGKITISKVHSNFSNAFMQIQIEDVNSGIAFLEVSMPMKEFAEALTGLGGVDCELETRYLERVGLKHETKEQDVSIDFTNAYSNKEKIERIKKFASAFEVNGWKADYQTGLHSRRFKGEVTIGEVQYQVYLMRFERWVEEL